MSKSNKERFKEALDKQKEAKAEANMKIIHVFRYEDGLLAVRADGERFRLPLGTFTRPLAVVMAGNMPDGDKIQD